MTVHTATASHGDSHRLDDETTFSPSGYSAVTRTVTRRYCARCGWLTFKGLMGGLRWTFEHETAHAAPLSDDSETLGK